MSIAQTAIVRSNLAGHNPIVAGAYIPLNVPISFPEKYGQIPNTWMFGKRGLTPTGKTRRTHLAAFEPVQLWRAHD